MQTWQRRVLERVTFKGSGKSILNFINYVFISHIEVPFCYKLICMTWSRSAENEHSNGSI